MASPDRRLLELLLPIFEQHADLVETVLPEHLRSSWRQAVAFADRTRGRKKRDHRDLLLAMAELDGGATLPARDLAITVVNRFPITPGAGNDERPHVQLPDGSCPARKDLIDRLVLSFDAERERLLGEVEMARDLASRAKARVERIQSGNGMFSTVKPARAKRTLDGNQIRAVQGASIPAVTAYNVDQVSKAITKRPKKP